MSSPSSSVLRGYLGPALLALLVSIAPRPAAAFINYFWQSGVSGSADDPSKWTPSGIPGFSDNLRFEVSGTYTVTYPATVPQSANLVCGIGNVTWSMASPHTTGGVFVDLPNLSNSLTMNSGSLTMDFLQLGASGRVTTMTLTNAGILTPGAVIHSKGINNPDSPSFGDHIGHDGITELDIVGGSHYFSDQVGSSWPLMIGVQPSAAATVNVAGVSTGPLHYSQLTVGTNGIIVGVSGVANLFAQNGGSIDCAGQIIVARDPTASGYVNVGPVAGLGSSSLNAQSDLLIGNNDIGPEAGHGEVIVKDRSSVTVGGHTVVGDPDDTVDPASVLRVLQGGTFTATNGLRVWPTSGIALDLQGGITRLTGGQLRWPANKLLTVSSTTGTPQLWISNGDTNIAPSTAALQAQLTVGGTGNGTLFVTHAGTIFPMGLGSMSVGDQAGSTGTVDVDTTATLSSGGPINVGVHGTGTMNVLGGGLVDVGTGAVGVAAGSVGTVLVSGSGSTLQVRDNLWIGGGFGGVGGTGSLTVDANATLSVLHVNGVNPALVTVYPAVGTFTLRNGGHLATTGTLDDRGNTLLDGGAIQALDINIPSTGTFGGQGTATLSVGIGTSGRIDPHSSADVIGTIGVTGSLQQFPLGHYVADLRAPGAGGGDLVTFTGTAALDGTLDLRTASGFVNHAGDTYTILTCSSRTGTFANVTWNGGPLAGNGTVVYDAAAVRVVLAGGTGVEATQGVSELYFAPAGNRSTLSFALGLPKEARVDATLYDVSGREVGTLFDGSLGAGRHTLTSAGAASSGVYFARATIRFEGRTVVRTARTVLVR
ncbi:MAG: hypothetical protein U0167_13915 [bacterium]